MADGREIELGPKLRTLFGALLNSVNNVVPMQRIVATMWPDTQPTDPRRAIYTYVSRLRRHLHELDASGRVRVLVISDGCQLMVDEPRTVASAPADRPRRHAAGQMNPAETRPPSRRKSVMRSWFRRAWGNATVQEVAATAAHAADSRLVLAQDAQVTATMLQHLGSVIESVLPMGSAVIRAGAMLLIKIDDRLVVHQLTAAQQLRLDHEPQLAMSPRGVLAALGIGLESP